MLLILGVAVLGGGPGVPCNRKPSYAGLITCLRLLLNRVSPRQAVLMVGSRATRNREPGQARKGAALSGAPGVPRECSAGAGYRG